MSQKHKTWEINGCSLPLDLEDLETVKRYENAFDLMSEDEKSLPKDGRVSARIESYCMMYHHLYDRIFGEGTAEQIFSGIPMNVSVYDDIYGQFLQFVREQGAENSRLKKESFSRYTPNRSQKRAAKKKK